eukprot:6213771-Pleurochrysis_carterae.AAC.1
MAVVEKLTPRQVALGILLRMERERGGAVDDDGSDDDEGDSCISAEGDENSQPEPAASGPLNKTAARDSHFFLLRFLVENVCGSGDGGVLESSCAALLEDLETGLSTRFIRTFVLALLAIEEVDDVVEAIAAIKALLLPPGALAPHDDDDDEAGVIDRSSVLGLFARRL